MKSALRQRGVAAVVFLAIFVLILVGVLTTAFGRKSVQNDFDAKTFRVLAAAKEALIAYAVASGTPGRLPCPDTDNDGVENAPCGSLGTNQLGRLPWKTLGIPDLRDGAGECLWYAVSGDFKISPLASPVNSDTTGGFAIKDDQGNYLAGSSAKTRAIAVVLAPNSALPGNDRASTGTSQCGGTNTSTNYLDLDADSGVNNANVDNSIGA